MTLEFWMAKMMKTVFVIVIYAAIPLAFREENEPDENKKMFWIRFQHWTEPVPGCLIKTV